jgi:hypothetical protein
MLLPAALACHSRSSTSQAVPGVAAADLSGVWAFNPEQSDRPDRPGSFGPGGPPGGGVGGRGRGGFGGGRGGGGGGGGGGRGGEGARPGGRPPGDSVFARPPQQLTIVQTDSTLRFQSQGGEPLTLFFDGGVVEIPARGVGPAVQVSGHWHNKRFEVERRTGGSTVAESYERSSDRTKLTVRTRVSDLFGDGPGIKRVYDWVGRPQ